MMSRSVGNRGPAQFEKPLTEVQKKRLQLVQEMREIYTKVRPSLFEWFRALLRLTLCFILGPAAFDTASYSV